jgi:predicted DNA binding protein
MVEAVPPGFEVEIHEIGTFPDAATAPTTALSERQRAAVTTALELGYYETPREATHADVAERLGCAPNTATEHLQKAEAKLVRNAMSTSGEST